MHISMVWIGESCSNNQLTNVYISTALITFSQYICIYIYFSHKRAFTSFQTTFARVETAIGGPDLMKKGKRGNR